MLLFFRLLATAGVLILARGVTYIAMPLASVGASRAAGLQMNNSDQDAVTSIVGMHFFSGIGAAIVGVTALLILVIWWGLIRRGWLALTAAALLLALAPAPVLAFYNATDTTEAYGILPNHTAFWVPGMGDTKNNQAHMESEDFLKQNKVPGKFFIIPHVKLSGSTYLGWDKYIPTGRLIVVDRAPFFHEWTKTGRGTGAGNESFPCHSKDNIEVSAEMSLASSVTEDNAARFLFYFGVNLPKGDASTPEVIFTSVYEGRTLAQVMGGWGRGEIQSRVCRHLNAYTVEKLAEHGNEILDAIQAEAKEFFGNFGITIEYVGWAGGFGYPKEVQDAINTRFAADHIAPAIATLEAKARIDAISGWDRHLPTSVTLLGGISGLVTDFLGAAKTPK